ncbi:MAG: VanZ family protein [Pseudomonadota bacterium]
MKKSLPLVPILVVMSVILLTSELLTVPTGTEWHFMYVQLDAAAHMVLYFFLGLCVARSVSVGLQVGAAGTLVLTAALCLALGVGDEFHQMHIEGRGAEFRDLFWDLLGALAGGFLYVATAGLWRWMKEFVSSAEVGIGTMVGRSLAVLTLLVGTLVPSVVYAREIADFFHSLAVIGSSSASAALRSYLQKSGLPQTPNHRTKAAPPGVSDNPSERRPSADTGTGAGNTVSVQEGARSKEVSPQDLNKLKEDLREEILREMRDRAVAAAAQNPVQTPTPGPEQTAVDPPSKQRAEARISSGTLTALGMNSVVRDRIINAINGGVAREKTIENRWAVQHNEKKEGRPYGVGTGKPEPCDIVAVITHLSNPVDELSLDQIRKIYSGEYENWNEVGGPDLPIRVVTARKRSQSVEKKLADHLRVPLSGRAARLPLLSLVIPVVAETEGAVGFLPLQDTEQLDWLVTHESFKKIAVKSDTDSEAVAPNRMALVTARYPIMR